MTCWAASCREVSATARKNSACSTEKQKRPRHRDRAAAGGVKLKERVSWGNVGQCGLSARAAGTATCCPIPRCVEGASRSRETSRANARRGGPVGIQTSAHRFLLMPQPSRPGLRAHSGHPVTQAWSSACTFRLSSPPTLGPLSCVSRCHG